MLTKTLRDLERDGLVSRRVHAVVPPRVQALHRHLAWRRPAKRRRDGGGVVSGTINAEWHKRHRMPKNPTVEQRIAWHVEHAKQCACRPIPPKLLEQMRSSTPARTKSRRRVRLK
jgi:hypothetical protein